MDGGIGQVLESRKCSPEVVKQEICVGYLDGTESTNVYNTVPLSVFLADAPKLFWPLGQLQSWFLPHEGAADQ